MLGNCDVANAYICGTLNIPALSINGNTAVTSIPGACCLGTTTASNSQTFTNKGGNISQWTNDCNYKDGTRTTTAINTQTFPNKTVNISKWRNDASFASFLDVARRN